MDCREPKCKHCENSGICNIANNLYCKCEVCEKWIKNHKNEDVNYSIDELYKQLRYCLHVSTNCDDGTSEIHRLIGQAVDKCREQKEKQMDETTLTIVTELFDDENKPREVLACTKCGQSYKTRHDVINFCSNCGRKIVGERPLSK